MPKPPTTESGFFRVVAGAEHVSTFREAMDAAEREFRAEGLARLKERRRQLRLDDVSDAQLAAIVGSLVEIVRRKGCNIVCVAVEATRPDKHDRPVVCPNCFRSHTVG